MARPSLRDANLAVSNIYAALSSGNVPVTVQRSGAAIDALNESTSALYQAFLGTAITVADATQADLQDLFVHVNLDITITDLGSADLEELFVADDGTGQGEVYEAYGRAVRVGDTFRCAGVGDTTDNALEAAKGSAVAADDVFIISNATVTTMAVVYAGNLVAATDVTFGSTLGRAVEIGDVFTVAGTGDTTDNALAAAKATGLDIDAQITITDALDADIADLTSAVGELGIDIGAMQVRDGFRFRVLGTGDTIDNALFTAKGDVAPAAQDVFEVTTAGAAVTFIGNAAACAASDMFEVTNVTIGSEAVAWIGNGTITLSGSSLARQ